MSVAQLLGQLGQPGAPTRARPSGCRVRTPLEARADRPSSTSRRTSAMRSDSSGSSSSSFTSGQRARCTDVGRVRRAQHVPHVVGDERHDRRHQPGDRLQALVQRGERRRDRRSRTGGGERRTYQLDRSSRNSVSRRPARAVSNSSSASPTSRTVRCSSASAHRSISGRSRVRRGVAVRRRPGLGVRVQGEERGGVPVGEQDLADDLLERGAPDPPGRPRRAGAGHEPAQRVGAVLVHERDRLQHVAEVLAHLAAVLGEDVAEADHVLVRGPAEDQRADRHQRVEPAAGLVDRLADVLRRVGLLEDLLVPVRRAPLGERHRARVVPGVDHVGHPAAPRRRRSGRGR